MADEMIRASMDQQSVTTFDNPAFVTPPPLSEATIAIVSTAGLRKEGQPGWKANDPGYREFARDDRDLTLGHLSPNFDRTGIAADLNIAYPIDRLEEMASEGVIGGVSPLHATYMGAQDELMEAIVGKSAPELAVKLKEAGTDVVLLVPV